MESSCGTRWKRFSLQSFNSLTANGGPLRRMPPTENLRNEADGNQEYLMTEHPLTGQSAETVSTSVMDTQEFNQETFPCKYPYISHQCSSWCNADDRSEVFGEGEGEDRFPRPMTALASQSHHLSVGTNHKRKVLREIWLSSTLIFLPMLIIPMLFAVLVIKYRLKSEPNLFSEVPGATPMQNRAYVLLDIPASEKPQRNSSR